MNWDIDWNTLLSSTVVAAIVSGIFKLIDVAIAARNRALRKKVRSLLAENKKLNTQLEELQQTVSDQKVTIEKLQESNDRLQIRYSSNQRNGGYSDYISW